MSTYRSYRSALSRSEDVDCLDNWEPRNIADLIANTHRLAEEVRRDIADGVTLPLLRDQIAGAVLAEGSYDDPEIVAVTIAVLVVELAQTKRGDLHVVNSPYQIPRPTPAPQ